MKSIKRFALSAVGSGYVVSLDWLCIDKATGKSIGFIWNTIGAPIAVYLVLRY